MKYRNRIRNLKIRQMDYDHMKVRTDLERGYRRPGSQRRG